MIEDDEPEAFVCPITQEIMDAPVVAADGHSYERAAIEDWLRGNATSPFTREPMPSTQLFVNLALRNAIHEWKHRQPLAMNPAHLVITEPEKLLGEGSFGKVVAGVRKTSGRDQPVAVKMLPSLSEQEQREQFDNELRVHIVAQQGADAVCRVLGTCEKIYNGSLRLCLIMRCYKRSLANLLQTEGTLHVDEVRRIGYPLCTTLHQLHMAGVVVQDIKPQNVLLDQFDNPVFADFGISDVISRTTKIIPTAIKGTFNYMAPEAFRPPLDSKADVWSMACVLVEMTTAITPFATLQMHQIMTAVLIDKKAPVVDDTVPAANVVRRCFMFEPNLRPTAQQLASSLTPMAAMLSDTAVGADEDGSVATLKTKLENVTTDLAAVTRERDELQRGQLDIATGWDEMLCEQTRQTLELENKCIERDEVARERDRWRSECDALRCERDDLKEIVASGSTNSTLFQRHQQLQLQHQQYPHPHPHPHPHQHSHPHSQPAQFLLQPPAMSTTTPTTPTTPYPPMDVTTPTPTTPTATTMMTDTTTITTTVPSHSATSSPTIAIPNKFLSVSPRRPAPPPPDTSSVNTDTNPNPNANENPSTNANTNANTNTNTNANATATANTNANTSTPTPNANTNTTNRNPNMNTNTNTSVTRTSSISSTIVSSLGRFNFFRPSTSQSNTSSPSSSSDDRPRRVRPQAPPPPGAVFRVDGAESSEYNGYYRAHGGGGPLKGRLSFVNMTLQQSSTPSTPSTSKVMISWGDSFGATWGNVGYVAWDGQVVDKAAFYHPNRNAQQPPTSGWQNFWTGQLSNVLITYL